MSSHHLAPPSRSSRRQPLRSTPLPEAGQLVPQSARQALESHLQTFDFARFFEVFPLNSPLSNFVESFSITSLLRLMHNAFTVVAPTESGSPKAQFVTDARWELEDELQRIDDVLKTVAAAQIEVQGVRDSLHWVRVVNRSGLEAKVASPARTLTASAQSHSTNDPSRGHRTSPPFKLPVVGMYSPLREDSARLPRSPSSCGHRRSSSLPYWGDYPGPPGFQITSGHSSQPSVAGTPTHIAATSNPSSSSLPRWEHYPGPPGFQITSGHRSQPSVSGTSTHTTASSNPSSEFAMQSIQNEFSSQGRARDSQQ